VASRATLDRSYVAGSGAVFVSLFQVVPDIATVLLVDDDPIILRCHVRCLNDEFRIETYSNPVDAYRRVLEGQVDVVVSDVSMPGMTGLELLGAIQRRDPFLPVILVSASSTIDGADKAILDGAFLCLTKAVDGAMFRAAVRLAVQYRRSPRTERPRSPPSKRPSALPRAGRPSAAPRPLHPSLAPSRPHSDARGLR
jgi:DNA-binding NtrC family response regulator